MTSRFLLSIVAPCYNEADGLKEFCNRTSLAARQAVGDQYELILVDDGSKDVTWEKIQELSQINPSIIGVKLLRNHGHQLAATAGLSVARGDRILLIDADLQDPPELLLLMMPIMDSGADVVYGQRSRRNGETKFKLMTASLFYRLLSRLASVPIPRDTGDFRLMNRRVVDLFLAMPERNRFIRGMVSWIGGRQVALPYERDARFAGQTGYPLRKMVNLAVDAITSFSIVPLRVSIWGGFISGLLAVALMVYTLIQWALGDTIAGWTSLMVAICAFFSVQFVCMGIMGEYLGRLVQEGKRRPMFMIDGLTQDGQWRYLSPTFSELSAADREASLDMALTSTKTVGRQANIP